MGASWEPRRYCAFVPLTGYLCYYGEVPVGPAGGSGAGLEQLGARRLAVWGAKLGSDGSPGHEKPAKDESRGTAWGG
jgi:hypothetical protein